jgi:hypothetical protein
MDMKTIVVLLGFLFFHITYAHAQSEWDFVKTSILGGAIVFHEDPQIITIEALIDRGLKHHKIVPIYFGAGIHFSSSFTYREIGGKLFANPALFSIGVSKKFQLFPYVFMQYVYKEYQIDVPVSQSLILMRSGFGLHGVSLVRSEYTIRSGIQFGYDLQQPQRQFTHRIMGELKIGVSKNIRG